MCDWASRNFNGVQPKQFPQEWQDFMKQVEAQDKRVTFSSEQDL
jgi:hypothetical protein